MQQLTLEEHLLEKYLEAHIQLLSQDNKYILLDFAHDLFYRQKNEVKIKHYNMLNNGKSIFHASKTTQQLMRTYQIKKFKIINGGKPTK